MSKLITIFGATGQQGGSLVREILSNPLLSKTFKIRAVTRDTTKLAAVKLHEQGCEVVKADQNDPASLRTALKGAHATFLVTNFLEYMDGAKEQQQGKNMADAAAAEGVEFLIFSSAPHVTCMTNGHLKHATHFDSKAGVEDYIRALPLKSAFYMPASFMQNAFTMKPQPGEDGSYTLINSWAPDSQIALIDVMADTGKFLAPALLDPAGYNHKRIYGAAGLYTPEQIVAAMSKATGKKVSFAQISDEQFAGGFPPAMQKELEETMILMREYQYYGKDAAQGISEANASLTAINEKSVTWEDFTQKNAGALL